MPHRSRPQPAADFDFTERLGPELASAIEKKGYSTLTPVQQSVLDPELEDRDLRISSQTGSGKTLAIGFVLRKSVVAECKAVSGVAHPCALVIVPTRELARQVEAELHWLYAQKKVRIASVTGGASYRDEHRALAGGPAIVVGTPGRLLDHLNRGAIDTSGITSVVLDEADRMLDLGFRDDLEAILALTPEGRRTHLVSATFPREVTALANRVQQDPVLVEGTPLGSANTDIDHVIHLVAGRERVDALVNVLLYHPEEQTLVFARTRADVGDIASELQKAGFAVVALSGEMEQNARNRALSAFKRGEARVLVATDVAARGIDVQDIARVVQVDPPTDADTYTHRSGRTGRAGRKGTSVLLVPPSALNRTVSLLQRAGVKYRFESVPTADTIRSAQDEQLYGQLVAESEEQPEERVQAQVARIMESGQAERALARLIARQRASGEPRKVTPLAHEPRGRSARERTDRQQRPYERAQGPRGGQRGAVEGGGGWVPFRVSWGEVHGADARRLVAMLCRRGEIRGSDIGAIRVGPTSSTVEVAAHVAPGFAAATSEPDPRDPRVRVAPLGDVEAAEPRQRRAHAPEDRKPRATTPMEERPQRRFHQSEARPKPRQHAVEARPERKAEPKPRQHAVEARPERKAEPKPRQHAVEARAERKPEPRAERKPEPRPQRRHVVVAHAVKRPKPQGGTAAPKRKKNK